MQNIFKEMRENDTVFTSFKSTSKTRLIKVHYACRLLHFKNVLK